MTGVQVRQTISSNDGRRGAGGGGGEEEEEEERCLAQEASVLKELANGDKNLKKNSLYKNDKSIAFACYMTNTTPTPLPQHKQRGTAVTLTVATVVVVVVVCVTPRLVHSRVTD